MTEMKTQGYAPAEYLYVIFNTEALDTPQLRRRLDKAYDECNYLAPFIAAVQPKRLLDVGCGPAIASILMAKAFALEMLYLMDGAEGPKRMGYHDDKKAWTSLERAQQIAQDNHVHHISLAPKFVAAGKWTFPPVDMAVSFISWGHHYPVSTYLDFVTRSLRPNGLLVLDLREGRGGLEELRQHGFRDLAIVEETPKRKRYVFERT